MRGFFSLFFWGGGGFLEYENLTCILNFKFKNDLTFTCFFVFPHINRLIYPVHNCMYIYSLQLFHEYFIFSIFHFTISIVYVTQHKYIYLQGLLIYIPVYKSIHSLYMIITHVSGYMEVKFTHLRE